MAPGSLPIHCELGNRFHWQLRDDSHRAAAESASREIEEPALIEPGRLLKAGTRRLIFRCKTTPAQTVVKAFPLDGTRQRLKHRKYADSEALNLDTAHRLNLPVPRLYGLGHKRRLGLVSCNAVLMEFVPGHPLHEMVAQATTAAQLSDLRKRAIALFQALYLSGCNHIDLRPDALILGSSAAADRIIDFQYCRFLGEPRPVTIGAQAGYFAHWLSRSNPDSRFLSGWIDQLLQALQIDGGDRTDAERAYHSNADAPRSIAARLEQ